MHDYYCLTHTAPALHNIDRLHHARRTSRDQGGSSVSEDSTLHFLANPAWCPEKSPGRTAQRTQEFSIKQNELLFYWSNADMTSLAIYPPCDRNNQGFLLLYLAVSEHLLLLPVIVQGCTQQVGGSLSFSSFFVVISL